MKIVTLLVMLVLTQAQATEPYPEFAGAKFPVNHWQLTMVSRDELVDIDIPGFENYSRTSCIRAGIERMKGALIDDRFGGIVPWLGFVCEFVKG